MFFDFGYDNLNTNEGYIKSAIAELDKHFDLVLIADYFDEGIILLKELLCWDFNDVLYVKTNARSQTSTILTNNLKKKINSWNKADYMLYEYFNQTFWEKVKIYGVDRMRNDVTILNQHIDKLKNNCIKGGDSVPNKLIKDAKNKVYNPRGVVMKGYNIKDSARGNTTCINLLKGEIPFTRELMAKANARKSENME